MEKENSKPFSMDYVLRTTTKHLRKSIDVSIKKTLDRIAEFDGDQVKSAEVFKTLAHLHKLKNDVEAFQAANI